MSNGIRGLLRDCFTSFQTSIPAPIRVSSNSAFCSIPPWLTQSSIKEPFINKFRRQLVNLICKSAPARCTPLLLSRSIQTDQISTSVQKLCKHKHMKRKANHNCTVERSEYVKNYAIEISWIRASTHILTKYVHEETHQGRGEIQPQANITWGWINWIVQLEWIKSNVHVS